MHQGIKNSTENRLGRHCRAVNGDAAALLPDGLNTTRMKTIKLGQQTQIKILVVVEPGGPPGDNECGRELLAHTAHVAPPFEGDFPGPP